MAVVNKIQNKSKTFTAIINRVRPQAYLDTTGHFIFPDDPYVQEGTSGSKILWRVTNHIAIIEGGIYVAATTEDVLTDIGDQYRVTRNGIDYIALPPNRLLVYDIDAEAFKIYTYDVYTTKNCVDILCTRAAQIMGEFGLGAQFIDEFNRSNLMSVTHAYVGDGRPIYLIPDFGVAMPNLVLNANDTRYDISINDIAEAAKTHGDRYNINGSYVEIYGAHALWFNIKSHKCIITTSFGMQAVRNDNILLYGTTPASLVGLLAPAIYDTSQCTHDAVCYITDGGTVRIDKNIFDGTCTYTITNGISLNTRNGNFNYPLNKLADINADEPRITYDTDADKLTIRLGANQFIYMHPYNGRMTITSTANRHAANYFGTELELNKYHRTFGQLSGQKAPEPIAPQLVPSYVNDKRAKLEEIASTYSNGNVEMFAFMTDMHYMSANDIWNDDTQAALAKNINKLHEWWSMTPCAYMLFGGDWLNAGDTPAVAKMKLGIVAGVTSHLFGDRAHHVIGNHDTNYQGKSSADAAANTGRLPLQSIETALLCGGKSYYAFDGPHARGYVLDSGIDWEQSVDDYTTEQLKWLAASLRDDDCRHSFLAMHIVTNTSESDYNGTIIPTQRSKAFIDVAAAYNAKSTITIGDTKFDFASTIGKVAYVIAGHTHWDANGVVNGIPVVITTNAYSVGADGTTPTFDVACVDYTNGTMHLVRIGNGNNRTVQIVA